MLYILSAWVLLILLLLSWGGGAYAVFARGLGGRYTAEPGFFHYIWAGFASLIGFLQIYSIFFAIDGFAALVVCLIAAVGLLSSYRYIYRGLERISKAPASAKVIVMAGIAYIALAAAYNASLPLRIFDTELYHLNAVSWANSYPAVPGLTNLHGRLGFNSSFHLFAALTNLWIWKDAAVHVANGFLLFLVSTQWLAYIVEMGFGRMRLSHAFAAFTAPFVVLSIFSAEASSLSADLPLYLITFVITLELLSIKGRLPGDGVGFSVMSRRNVFTWFVIVSLAAVLFSVKLSGAPVFFPILAASLIILLVLERSRYSKYPSLRHLLTFYGLSAIVVGGLVARHVILSGWLLYPLPFGNLHLDWSAKPEQIYEMIIWIKSWARMPGMQPEEVLGRGFLHWFIPWVDANFVKVLAASFLFCIGIAGLVYLWIAKKACSYRPSKAAPVVLAASTGVLGIVYWFASAPDFRFGIVFFLIFSAASVSPAIHLLIKKRGKGYLAVFTLAGSFVITVFLLTHPGSIRGDFTSSFPEVVFFDLPASASREVVAVVVDNGQDPALVVYRPKEGTLCGNSPLPCSPSIDKESRIGLRVPGNIGKGFRAMEH